MQGPSSRGGGGRTLGLSRDALPEGGEGAPVAAVHYRRDDADDDFFVIISSAHSSPCKAAEAAMVRPIAEGLLNR